MYTEQYYICNVTIFRVLKNNRTKIHMHLFIATVLHVIARIIVYTTADIDLNKYSVIDSYKFT